jgi:hypothetical protein
LFPGTLEKFLGKDLLRAPFPEGFRSATALMGEYSKSQKEAATNRDNESRIASNESDGSKESSIRLKGGFPRAIRTFKFERPIRFWEQKLIC